METGIVKSEARWERGTRPIPHSAAVRWLAVLTAMFIAGAVFGVGCIFYQVAMNSRLASENLSLRIAMAQMRGQNTAFVMVPGEAAPGEAGSAATHAVSDPASADAGPRAAQQIPAPVSTRETVSARVRDEFAAPERAAKRRLYRFELAKSQTFQRQGPIQISLRKTHAEQQAYDIVILLDHHQLTKKSVVLYEPIWLYRDEQSGPIGVVVDGIDNNQVRGYVSAPEYPDLELVSDLPNHSQQVVAGHTTVRVPSSTHPPSPSSAPATSSEGHMLIDR